MIVSSRIPLLLLITLELLLPCDIHASAVVAKTRSLEKKHLNLCVRHGSSSPRLGISFFRQRSKDSDKSSKEMPQSHDYVPSRFPLQLMTPIIFPLSRMGFQDSVSSIFVRGMKLMKRSNKIMATAGIISCALGCHMITHPTRANAQDTTQNAHAKKMGKIEVLSRVSCFWWRAAPIIVHYKFTQAWVNVRYRKIYNGIDDITNNRLDEEIRRGRRDEIYDELHDKYASIVLDLLLDMRGLFIKIGQVVSSRPDFIPRQYIDCLSSLQDDVPPWDTREIKQIVADSLGFHHGLLDFESVFSHFDESPIGSASIGQVHRATLTDEFMNKIKSMNKKNSQNKDKVPRVYHGGRQVAVKVMHLDAEDRFRNDLKIFKWLSRIALPGWGPILSEFEKQIMTEFDYLNEASNLQSVRDNMLASPYKNQVVVPEPLIDYSTPNVLIMEYLDGVKLAQAVENDLAVALRGDKKLAKSLIDEKRAALFNGTLELDPVREMKTILSRISDYPLHQQMRTVLKLAILQRKQKKAIELLLDVHGHQILVDGKFNGDCHPGNVLSLSSGKLGLIDYGQCKTLSDIDRQALRKIISHLGSPKVDEVEITKAMLDFGFSFKNDDKDIIRQTANLFFDSDAYRRKVGCATTQEYLLYLQKRNPFENVPDAAVFVARASFLFRGLGSLLGLEVHTSRHWAKHARKSKS